MDFYFRATHIILLKLNPCKQGSILKFKLGMANLQHDLNSLPCCRLQLSELPIKCSLHHFKRLALCYYHVKTSISEKSAQFFNPNLSFLIGLLFRTTWPCVNYGAWLCTMVLRLETETPLPKLHQSLPSPVSYAVLRQCLSVPGVDRISNWRSTPHSKNS